MKTIQRNSLVTLLGLTLLSAGGISTSLAQTAPPPTLGESTKGTPAVIDETGIAKTETAKSADAGAQNEINDDKPKSLSNRLLGEAEITESKRESGQVYRIELEHSSGSKQYIEENDSDGQINPDGIDLEDTPNLPKWKIGSW